MAPQRYLPRARTSRTREGSAGSRTSYMSRAPTLSPDPKRTIQDYWERKPCGSKHASALEGEPEYFAQVEKRRYELEPFIPTFADFEGSRGKRVLEIGVGLGTDFVRFARAGATVTGVDITQHSIDLVTRR